MRFYTAALIVLAALPAIAQTTATAPVLARRAVSANPVAQTDFDEGLTALYAFAPEVARTKFNAAAAADPQLAMAYWGIALSYGPNVNDSYEQANQRAAHDAIAKAQRLEASASPADRALIDAAAARYRRTGPDDGERAAAAYHDAMRVAATAFGNDPDVLALAAESALEVQPWAWYDRAGVPAPGILQAQMWLRAALAIEPQHLGALHFTIHATELSPKPQDGLAAAERLSATPLPPYAEHLAHMPAHTFMRVGMYHEAGEANARALSLDPDASGYRDHDALFGTDAFMMSGERANANAIAERFSDPGSRDRAKSRIVVRFNLCTKSDPAALGTPFARGVCFARTGNVKAAERELANLQSAGDDIDAIALLVVRSEIARAAGNSPVRINLLRQAVDIQDRLGYGEPPDWYYPVRESFAAALLAAGDAAGARDVFARDLELTPHNPRSLFGLAAAQAKLGEAEGSRASTQAFQDAWKHADMPLTLDDL
jgi:tetratricopeptide (TPR) repeat protein